MLTQTILCSLTTGKPDEPIYCRYGEKGRQIKFGLINPITDFTGYEATFYLFKPDGNFVVESLTIDNAEGYATLTLDENMTSASGRGVWDIKLSKTNVVIYTFSGEILIDKPTVNDEVINSVSVVFGHTFPDDYQLKLIAGDGINIDELTNTISVVGGGGGTTNYNELYNKPKINNVELSGNKTTEDLIPIGSGLEFDNGELTAPTPTISYGDVTNKPKINNVELSGNKTTEDLIKIGNLLEFDLNGKLNAKKQIVDYSTNEIATGEVWTDGKPIYKRVFTGTMPDVTQEGTFVTNDIAEIDFIDTIIEINGNIMRSNGSIYPSPYTNDNGRVSRIYAPIKGEDNKRYLTASSNWTTVANANCYAILKYTKKVV